MYGFTKKRPSPPFSREYFIHLSDLVGTPVFVDNKRIGTLYDLYGSIAETFPHVHGMQIRIAGRRDYLAVPLDNVKSMTAGKAIHLLQIPPECSPIPEGVLLLRKAFWDKQIVDISGAKVVRVNDLHLLRDNNDLWVVHVDVGFDGLLRRLGWYNPLEKLLHGLFGYRFPENAISWRYMDAANLGLPTQPLHLNQIPSKLAQMLPQDLGEILTDLGTNERLNIVRSLKPEVLASVLPELPTSISSQMFDYLDNETLSRVLDLLPHDRAASIIPEIAPEKLRALGRLITEERIQELSSIMSYEEGTAGSIMETRYISCTNGQTAQGVIDTIRTADDDVRFFEYIFINDENGRLVDVLTLRRLIALDPAETISKALNNNLVWIEPNADIEFVVNLFMKYRFLAIPVIDENHRMKGVVELVDILEYVEPEIHSEPRPERT